MPIKTCGIVGWTGDTFNHHTQLWHGIRKKQQCCCSVKAGSIPQLLYLRMEREHWLWTHGLSGKTGRYMEQKTRQRQLLLPQAISHKHGKVSQSHPVPLWPVLRCRARHKALSVTDRPLSWMSYTILRAHRIWNVSASLMRPSGFESSSRRWARQRFNYAVIECDSLITKGKMWGLISTPRAVASARDDRTNRYLE